MGYVPHGSLHLDWAQRRLDGITLRSEAGKAMSYFGVTAEKIDTVRHHSNADRLDICTLKGMAFQFVTGRDQYKAGEVVLYFPVDSLLPVELQRKMGVEGMLSGKNKDRVKTVRLRGEISQGLVGPQSLAEGWAAVSPDVCNTKAGWGVEIAEWLGVTKYEPAPIDTTGNLLPLPCGLSAYDIEGADRNIDAVNRLMFEEVVVTEKVEGQNFSVTFDPVEHQVYVNQRNFTIEEIDTAEHRLWRLARKASLIPDPFPMNTPSSFLEFLAGVYPGQSITVYGEAYGPGIQGNYYKIPDIQVRLFDIKVGYDFVDYPTFVGLVHMFWRIDYKFNNLITAPVLFVGQLIEWLEDRTIVEASSGPSAINSDVLREGVVIRPFIEQRHPEIGRLIIKQRDPVYLVNEK